MRKYIFISLFLVNLTICLSQNISKCDSSYIYQHFLFYDLETRAFDDINEPYIEEYWATHNQKAKQYYYKSAFIKSIPVVQRVILVSYLEPKNKLKAHQWICNNLQTRNDTIAYFSILDSSYGFAYSKLEISTEIVHEYCSECKYK